MIVFHKDVSVVKNAGIFDSLSNKKLTFVCQLRSIFLSSLCNLVCTFCICRLSVYELLNPNLTLLRTVTSRCAHQVKAPRQQNPSQKRIIAQHMPALIHRITTTTVKNSSWSL